jgi:hypothetical protein
MVERSERSHDVIICTGDLHEGDAIDETAFKALIRAAVAFNRSKASSH